MPARRPPLVIAHRGASGYRPEHTLEAYALAIEQGADVVEPDLVSTLDGVLVARHDNVLDRSTDVASRPEFADRRATRVVDGVVVRDAWFSEDFTLEEVRRLRAVEPRPDLRPASRAFDGAFGIPTLEEVLDLVRAREEALGRRIGVYPETKHPSHFAARGLPLEEPLLRALEARGYRAADAPVWIQSFEVGNLRRLARLTRLPLVQLIGEEGRPPDVAASGGSWTYDEMASPTGLRVVARYARAVAVPKDRVRPAGDASGRLGPATSLVRDAHAAGLEVHAWTFRAENAFLPPEYRRGDPADPAASGDLEGEVTAHLEAGIDGFFTDHPDRGRRARDAWRLR